MKSFFLTGIHRFRLFMVSKNRDRGAIAVEYALGMMLAATLMMGVDILFRKMAIEVIDFFKQLVIQFPNI